MININNFLEKKKKKIIIRLFNEKLLSREKKITFIERYFKMNFEKIVIRVIRDMYFYFHFPFRVCNSHIISFAIKKKKKKYLFKLTHNTL